MKSTELVETTPGLTYRKLDFWCRHGVFGNEKIDPGSGYRREFSEVEVRIARIVNRLSEVLGMWTGRRGGAMSIYRAVAQQVRDGVQVSAVVQLGGGCVLVVDIEHEAPLEVVLDV